jgi:hypothetical protein
MILLNCLDFRKENWYFENIGSITTCEHRFHNDGSGRFELVSLSLLKTDLSSQMLLNAHNPFTSLSKCSGSLMLGCGDSDGRSLRVCPIKFPVPTSDLNFKASGSI